MTPAACLTRWASSDAGSESVAPLSLGGELLTTGFVSMMGDSDAPEEEEDEVTDAGGAVDVEGVYCRIAT